MSISEDNKAILLERLRTRFLSKNQDKNENKREKLVAHYTQVLIQTIFDLDDEEVTSMPNLVTDLIELDKLIAKLRIKNNPRVIDYPHLARLHTTALVPVIMFCVRTFGFPKAYYEDTWTFRPYQNHIDIFFKEQGPMAMLKLAHQTIDPSIIFSVIKRMEEK